MREEPNVSEPLVKNADATWKDSLPCATVSRPAAVHKLELPFDVKDFDDPDFRHGFAANYTLGFLPAQLRALRKSDEMSQKALAVKLDTQQSAVSRAEQVDYGNLNIATAIKMGEALDRPFMAYWGTYSELLQHVASSERNPRAFLASPSFTNDPGFRHGHPPIASSNADQVFRVQKALFRWLDTDLPDPVKFLRFLEGFDLPPMGADTPPRNVILRALADWGLAGAAWTRFLRAIARCIQFVRPKLGKESAEVAESLFHVCREIESPEVLGGQLETTLEVLDSQIGGGATGDFISKDLRAAFTAALVRNSTASLRIILEEQGRGQHPSLFFAAGEREAAVEKGKMAWKLEPTPELMRMVDRIWGVSFSRPSPQAAKEQIASTLEELFQPQSRRGRLYLGSSLLFCGLKRGNWAIPTSNFTAQVLRDRYAVNVLDMPRLATTYEESAFFGEIVNRLQHAT